MLMNLEDKDTGAINDILINSFFLSIVFSGKLTLRRNTKKQMPAFRL